MKKSVEPGSQDSGWLLKQDEDRVYAYLAEDDAPPWSILKLHPSFNDKWVVYFLRRHRAISKDAVREIYNDLDLRRRKRVWMAMVGCRATPASISMNLANRMRVVDILKVIRQPHLTGGIIMKMEAKIRDVYPGMSLGEKITLARAAPRALIKLLRTVSEQRVMAVVVKNPYFTYDDALFLASFPRSEGEALYALAESDRWLHFKPIRLALIRHPNTPNAVIRPLLKDISAHDAKQLLADPQLRIFPRRLIEAMLSQASDS